MQSCEITNHTIHTYLCNSLQNLLDKNNEVYLTQAELQHSKPILDFFEGSPPDFLIKTKPGRDKPLIVDVDTGDSKTAKYSTFGSVADAVTVHPDSLLVDTTLTRFIPMDDLIYLHRNVQAFIAEYWKSKVLMNTFVRIELHISVARDSEAASQFAEGMKQYAENVLDRSKI